MSETKTNEKCPVCARRRKLCIIFVIGVLFVVVFVVPVIQSLDTALHHRDCPNHIKQIAFAMYDYREQYGTLPPAYTVDDEGKPLHSWRTLLLPFLEQDDLYKKIKWDEPWDSEHNRQFHDQMPKTFSCPKSLKHFKWNKDAREKWETTITAYQIVVGPETLFPGSECTTMNDVTRNHADTVMVVESTVGVCWMAPMDLPVEALEHGVVAAKSGILGIGSYHDGGANVAMVDGRCEFLVNSKSTEDVRALKQKFRIKE